MDMRRSWEAMWMEMRPSPDRASGTLRITVAALSVAVVMLTFRMPFPYLGPYLVFLVSQRDTFLTRAAAALGVVASAMACVLIYAVADVAWDVAWLRVALWTALFGGGFFLMHVLIEPRIILGPLVIISLFTFAFDQHPFPNRILSELGWLWAILGLTVATTLLVQWLLEAPTAIEFLRGQFRRLLIAAERSCLKRAWGRRPDPLDQEELESALDRVEKLGQAGVLSPRQSENCRRWLLAVESVGRAAEMDPSAQAGAMPAWIGLAARVRGIRRRILWGIPVAQEPGSSPAGIPALRMAEGALAQDHGEPAPEDHKAMPVLAPDWGSNPAHVDFAMRATVATMSCYLFMSLTAWDGIHTCMITCVVSALANLPAGVRKQNNRILGAILGGVLGWVSVVLLIPRAESLPALLLILGAGTALSAWVTLGSERRSYVGWQMALAFYMTVLQGPHPSTRLDVLSDRLAGILIGILAMRVAFHTRSVPSPTMETPAGLPSVWAGAATQKSR